MANWTLTEFVNLLNNHALDDAAAGKMIRRSAGAVGAVRGGIDAWHRKMNHSMLSKMMISYLASGGRPRHTCARCGSAL